MQYAVSGVIHLTNCMIDMPSYTYALKAQRLLRARGYPCTVKRRDRSSDRGCGFSLLIQRDCSAALEALDTYDIPYSIRNGGETGDDKL